MKKRVIFPVLLLLVLAVNAEEISISVSGGSISGDLIIPKNTPGFPLALIVAGSGPTDRDGNSGQQLQTNAYRQLAENLASNGIASFRFDKRMVGKSIFVGQKESDLTFSAYVEDLRVIISYLKTLEGVQRIYLIGHSEGSLLSILAAEETQVSGLVSISGVGKNAADLLKEQIGANPNNPKSIKKEANQIIDRLKQGERVERVSRVLETLFRPSVQPYLISWFKYDPSQEIKKLNIPILVLQGDQDIQVSVNDAQTLYRSCKNGRVVIIPAMTHTMKTITEKNDQAKSYTDASLPISNVLVDSIIDFINE